MVLKIELHPKVSDEENKLKPVLPVNFPRPDPKTRLDVWTGPGPEKTLLTLMIHRSSRVVVNGKVISQGGTRESALDVYAALGRNDWLILGNLDRPTIYNGREFTETDGPADLVIRNIPIRRRN